MKPQAIEMRRGESAPFTRELPIPPGNVFVRALTARAISALSRRETPAEVAAKEWPSDRTLAMVLRAASAPAMMGVLGWSAELIHKVIIDALEALGPASAGAQLLRSCTVLNFDDGGIISAPGFVAAAANAGFVADGDPIPVRQLNSTAVQMSPHKLAAISVLTQEMILSSNAEQLIGDTLIRSAAAALDVNLFDQVAANAVRPSGLRNGIATLTASVNTSFWDAYFEDASSLVNAISTVAGVGPYAMIANPGRAMEIKLRAWGGGDPPFAILASNQLGADILIAVALDALIAAIAPLPDIELANATTLHMNDAPLVIVNGGAPAVPQKSMFQTDSVALKMRWRLSWALRDQRGVAWLTPAWK